ncbi:MAG: thymidylate synthase [Bacillota bacterium]
MNVFYNESLGVAWMQCMEYIMEHGNDFYDEERKLKEIVHVSFRIKDAYLDPVLEEFANIDRIKLMEEKYCTCGLVGEYKIDYGSYIFNNNGINQVDWVTNRLKNKKETKSATISLHKAGENDLTCLSILDFKVRDEKLIMCAVYRSQNAYSSMPGNILALRKIQSEIATSLGIELGCVELVVMSSHIYEENFEQVNSILKAYKK